MLQTGVLELGPKRGWALGHHTSHVELRYSRDPLNTGTKAWLFRSPEAALTSNFLIADFWAAESGNRAELGATLYQTRISQLALLFV